jgi:hypothetical protein
MKNRAEMSVKEQLLQMPPYFVYYGNVPLGETWGIGPMVDGRDADLITTANGISLKEALKEHPEFEDKWCVESFNHWAVGWVENVLFEVVDEDGELSAIAQFMLDWQMRLDDYPIMDEELHSQLEYDNALEVIKNTTGCDDGEAQLIFEWIFDNHSDEIYGEEGPSWEAIKKAMKALKLEDEDEDW